MDGIMTLIELFDPCQLENAAGVVFLRPERAVYIGYADEMTPKRREKLSRFLERNVGTRYVEYINVPRDDFTEIERAVAYIANKYSQGECVGGTECVFDLSGGDERIAAAFGSVAQVMKLCMVKSDIDGMRVLPLKNAEHFSESTRVHRVDISINESVALYGGAVINEREADCRRKLSREDRRDISALWNICKSDTRLWNRQIAVLSALEQNVKSGNTVDVRPRGVVFGRTELPQKSFMESLVRSGLISAFRMSDAEISYSYKSDFVRRCMEKAGNALEYYVYMCAVTLSESEEHFFGDVAVGVETDWDGISGSGTRNEIDVIAMRGLVPVFISCKNGGAKKEALYELDTVSHRYGGEHAVRILVTTRDRENRAAREALIARAEDMGIAVIGDTDVLSDRQFTERLRRLCTKKGNAHR